MMANKRDDFAQVCHRMQALMHEQPIRVQNSSIPRLDEMIQRLGMIATEQRAA